MAGRPTRSGGLVLAGMADSSQPADRPATRLFDRLSAGFARPLAMVRRVLSEPEERCDVSSRRSSGRMPPAHATAEGRLLMVRHLTRKIPALADSFATLRGFVPRVRSPEGHLTPTRTLQPLSRSVIGARSAARSPNSSSTGLEPCLRARSCPVQPETCRIAPSRLVPRPTSTGGQTWRTGDSSACRDTSTLSPSQAPLGFRCSLTYLQVCSQS
jgi:hypothetical protein